MILLLLAVSVLTVLSWNLWRARQKLPKGPVPLPIIGNLHQLVYYSWKHGGTVPGFHHFKSQFRKVFTLWIGPLPTVYISDFDVARETHVKRANTFGSRLSLGVFSYIRGQLTMTRDFWQDHKKFTQQTLRNFGVGRNLMEEKIMEEYKYRFEDFKRTHFENKGIQVDVGSCFDLLVGSIINKLLFSERFAQNDKEFEELKTNLAKTLESISIIDVLTPVWLLKSSLWQWRSKKIVSPFQYIFEAVKRKIQKRVSAIESGEHVMSEDGDDFVDVFLMKAEKDGSDFNLDTLAIGLYDLWIAGQETTATTLTWACACLLNHPEVVEELRSELVQVTGRNRNLSLTDRTKTPYLNATIHEIQRMASILNNNLFRVVEEDTVIDGQPIPAGTAVTVQLSMLHTDENVFKNPAEFSPKRFLENHNLEKTLIPFGIGKRSCPGEALARAELYLIIGNMVLDYNFEPVGSLPELRTPTPFGVAKRPPVFCIRFVPVEN